jgi:hypothetical protein
MRRFIGGSLAALALSVAVASAPALAADPTMEEIYQAANGGQLDRAQQMMDQVLKDHPDSAKAHYVQAELYAREHQVALARQELARAEQLKPGLPDISQRSQQELKAELGLAPRTTAERPYAYRTEAQTPTFFPWKTVLVLAVVVLVFWALFRRRRSYVSYPGGTAPMAGPGPGYGPGGYGPGGYGPGYGPGGGGLGSTVAGGLAGGLAAGAGVVAGEELAHHFLDGGQQGGVVPPANAGEWNDAPPNNDMGGNDFGVNDPGSWDDGGGGGGDFGGGGGGGDDWT